MNKKVYWIILIWLFALGSCSDVSNNVVEEEDNTVVIEEKVDVVEEAVEQQRKFFDEDYVITNFFLEDGVEVDDIHYTSKIYSHEQIGEDYVVVMEYENTDKKIIDLVPILISDITLESTDGYEYRWIDTPQYELPEWYKQWHATELNPWEKILKYTFFKVWEKSITPKTLYFEWNGNGFNFRP